MVELRHSTEEKIDEAITKVINAYNRFSLPKIWGTGKTASADGTKLDLYEQNLLHEHHLRYLGTGGLGYYHLSDAYSRKTSFRLGHIALNVRNFTTSLRWYQDILGFRPSDILYDRGKAVGSFLHCQQGENWVDHHTVAIFETPTGIPHIHHASFEVEDLDAVFMGHEWLQEQNYHLAWGVGRHIYGSQIFDYWFNPDGFMMEHYSDGDLVNKNIATGHHPAGPSSLYQWGPRPPGHFLD